MPEAPLTELYPRFTSFAALHAAALRAQKGKRYRPAVLTFNARLEANLCQLQHELLGADAARKEAAAAAREAAGRDGAAPLPQAARLETSAYLKENAKIRKVLALRGERGQRKLARLFKPAPKTLRSTAMDNLLLPLVQVHGLSEAEARARVREPLERFGLADHAHKRPAELSGGQKQRIAILRALVVQPRRLFLDEPTSALDPEMTAEVLEMIGELKDLGTQFVLVTHEMAFARRVADLMAFVGDGGVLAHGPPEEIIDHCDVPRVRSFFARILP
jgi:ABC-type polar amino acid transport system ATPase subunit